MRVSLLRNWAFLPQGFSSRRISTCRPGRNRDLVTQSLNKDRFGDCYPRGALFMLVVGLRALMAEWTRSGRVDPSEKPSLHGQRLSRAEGRGVSGHSQTMHLVEISRSLREAGKFFMCRFCVSSILSSKSPDLVGAYSWIHRRCRLCSGCSSLRGVLGVVDGGITVSGISVRVSQLWLRV